MTISPASQIALSPGSLVTAALTTWVAVSGPAISASSGSARPRPSGVHTVPASSQSVPAGRATVIAPLFDGVIVICQRWLLDGSIFVADVMVAPPICSAAVRKESPVTSTGSPNASSKLTAVLPSCLSGTPRNSAATPARSVACPGWKGCPDLYPGCIREKTLLNRT